MTGKGLKKCHRGRGLRSRRSRLGEVQIGGLRLEGPSVAHLVYEGRGWRRLGPWGRGGGWGRAMDAAEGTEAGHRRACGRHAEAAGVVENRRRPGGGLERHRLEAVVREVCRTRSSRKSWRGSRESRGREGAGRPWRERGPRRRRSCRRLSGWQRAKQGRGEAAQGGHEPPAVGGCGR